MSDLDDGLAALHDARDDYEQAEKYFRGAVPEIFVSVRMRQLLARAGVSYRVNFCKLPVTVLANRLRIAAVTASTPDAQDALDDIWRVNRMNLLTKSLHRKVGEFGDYYVIVWPNADGRNVDIKLNGPLTTRMVYDSEDEDEPLFLIKRWHAAKDLMRANLYYADRIERWSSDEKAQKWERFVDPDDGLDSIANPYERIPGFHFRNDMPYGIPDHIDAYGIQDALNKLVAVQMGNVDFYGFPQRAALAGISPSTDEVDRDDLWEDESDGLPGDDVDGQAATIQASPDKMWILRNIASLVQLPAADPSVFIQPFLLFVRAMAQVTETPVRHLDPQGDVPSGESQRASDAPLDKRVEDRQEYLNAGYEEMFPFALRVYASLREDSGVAGDVSVDVRWAPGEQTDDVEDWQVAQAKLDAGVPPKTVLVEAGYAPEQVDQWITDTPGIALRPRVDLLVKIASAAQSLGASSALGVIDPDLVQQAIAALTQVDSGTAA